jgi:hypothetical protein
MTSVGTPTIEQVVDLFLGGQPHIEKGPWLIQKGIAAKSRRINAVALWSQPACAGSSNPNGTAFTGSAQGVARAQNPGMVGCTDRPLLDII